MMGAKIRESGISEKANYEMFVNTRKLKMADLWNWMKMLIMNWLIRNWRNRYPVVAVYKMMVVF